MLCGRRLVWHKSTSKIFQAFLLKNSISVEGRVALCAPRGMMIAALTAGGNDAHGSWRMLDRAGRILRLARSGKARNVARFPRVGMLAQDDMRGSRVRIRPGVACEARSQRRAAEGVRPYRGDGPVQASAGAERVPEKVS